MNIFTHEPRLKVFTWHVHGSYLYYLSQGNYDLYIPVNKEKSEGYYGRGETFPFGENVIEIPAGEIKTIEFDCILFQSEKNYMTNQFEVLSTEQRQLPRVYVEHNTPEGHPTNTLHIVDDPDVVVVHVTHFNKLMWHNTTPHIRVIEHGITRSGVEYKGHLAKGITVINHIEQRGRITGWDIFEEVRKHVPIDLVGMGTSKSGGLGEVLHPDLPQFLSNYRFFFNPIRYTSFGLAVCEAMMVGMPVVALATTEYASVIKNGDSGFINTNIDALIEDMKLLVEDRVLANTLGIEAQTIAKNRFNINRFTNEWYEVFQYAIQLNTIDHD
ncbi:glycosyltransferase family 4 protein [Emticicia sp. C21]|uniref:glycosyltransferase n=1 Tax=Emticicia sp. C21 TaxID=2302915 RepID=UPI000E34E8BD|nr:glycosyltransferase family 4 protein [Emticicia sp. C21]RFS17537.1 glycosyltransferase family 1 protein [Emticicia sp. C21]